MYASFSIAAIGSLLLAQIFVCGIWEFHARFPEDPIDSILRSFCTILDKLGHRAEKINFYDSSPSNNDALDEGK